MIGFLALAGLFLLLKLPIVGVALFKGIQHGLLHVAAHHETVFICGLSALLVCLVVLIPASLFLGWYWTAGDAVIVILVLRSLLRPDQGH